jgi:hypothetical protein
MLFVHWIRDGMRRGQLSMASSSCGGGPARRGGQNREKEAKWACANARASAWGAPGCVRGPEEGVLAREQELASQREAWRLGWWRRDMERQEQASTRPRRRRARRRRARGTAQSGAGAAGVRHMAGKAVAVRRAEKQSVAEPPELFRFKCASHLHTADNDSTHFKRNNPLVCRVSARYNHSSTGSREVYLARRRVYNHRTAHQLLIYR